MRVRWIGLTLACVLLGLAAGYGLGVLARTEPTTFAAPRPVPAQSPSIPVLPTPPFDEDIDYPALQPGLEFVTRQIGDLPYFLWKYDSPRGWVMTTQDRDEVRWRPADEPETGGFSLRVKLVNENKTPQQMVEQKHNAIVSSYDDVVILREGGSVLSFSYREPVDQTKRFNTFRWFSAPGNSEAAFEMSVVGRERDLPGLEDMLEQVTRSVRKVP